MDSFNITFSYDELCTMCFVRYEIKHELPSYCHSLHDHFDSCLDKFKEALKKAQEEIKTRAET